MEYSFFFYKIVEHQHGMKMWNNGRGNIENKQRKLITFCIYINTWFALSVWNSVNKQGNDIARQYWLSNVPNVCGTVLSKKGSHENE